MERKKLLEDAANKYYYEVRKNEEVNVRARTNTYDDHPMGNLMPKGDGDNNRGAFSPYQHSGKIMQKYYGSQQNPYMGDEQTVPFNINNSRWHL